MVKTMHYDLQTIFDADGGVGVFGKVASQLMELHRRVSSVQAPIVLECGVDKGVSSGVLAHAVEGLGGSLVSLDIRDCSDVIESDCWTCLQTDDSDKEFVLRNAPILRSGIDLVFIDSLHKVSHVSRLIDLWYPLVRQGGWMAFHDVDPRPYMRGQRKDNRDAEIVWRGLGELVLDFFYDNEDDLLLEFHYGSTGLAILQKLTSMSKAPARSGSIRPRYVSWRSLARSLFRS